MKLQVPFIQLPLQFDATRLAAEMDALGPDPWREHPNKYPGNFSLPLIAVDGDPDNDEVAGPMRPTAWLGRCPYLMQVLEWIGAVWGRTRLMKLSGGAEVTPHVDINYYWREHMRVHVPIRTQPGVRFLCGEAEVHMGAGECWIFDTWRLHRVLNVPDRERVHLVADTVGGDRFWQFAAHGRAPGQPGAEGWYTIPFTGDDSDARSRLMVEQTNVPEVMTPWELREHLEFLIAHIRPDPQTAMVEQAGMQFAASWRTLWARFGEAPEGRAHYRELLDRFDGWVQSHAALLQLQNGTEFLLAWRAMIGKFALREDVPVAAKPAASATRPAGHRTAARADFDRPVFIVSPPRSGSTMLFEALSQSPDACTIGGESHLMLEVDLASGSLGTIARGYPSNRLDAGDATPAIADELRGRFHAAVFDREGQRPPGPIRLLEKTPKNALRVPFLARVFPDARFVYLYRDPREVLASMLEAWESGRFRTYPNLPGWTGLQWSLLLIPGWRDLVGKPLPEIVAAQWSVTTRMLLDDLEHLPSAQCTAVSYDRFIANPDAEIRKLCARLDLRWDRPLGTTLPKARYTVSAPRSGKWRARESEILPQLAGIAAAASQAEQAAARYGAQAGS